MNEKRQDPGAPHARRAPSQSSEPPYEQFHKGRLVQSLVAMLIITAIFYAVWM